MLEAVFISDLHLQEISSTSLASFKHFLTKLPQKTHSLYILGDFFHAWCGDDNIEPWSQSIIQTLKAATLEGMAIYLMQGNRDFLLGSTFAALTGVTLLSDPHVIILGNERVLLAHGDKYCTQDKTHQYFRALTRNALFPRLFTCLPLSLRKKIVGGVRKFSVNKQRVSRKAIDVVKDAFLTDMKKWDAGTLIHGHTHKPGSFLYIYENKKYSRYILSDWDDKPVALCYDKSKGYYFDQIN